MFDAYMRLLRRLFGETGALSAYLVLRRVGFALALAGAGVVVAGAVYLLVPDEPDLEHVGYRLAAVDRLDVLDGDARFGVVANVTLPDGKALRLVATKARVARSVGDSACVEIQRNPATGQILHRLVVLGDCSAD